jgi:hypothetical protein
MKTSMSAPRALAHEASSHELARLLDDAAALLWRACGEDSRIGRLADEARWAAFVLHDRIARHAVEEAGAAPHQLAIQPLTPLDKVWRGPDRFARSAARARPGGLAADDGGELGAALSTCKATLIGISIGYARGCGRAHPLLEALRRAEQAVDALHAELAGAAPPVSSARVRTIAPAPARGPRKPGARAAGTLLLLRGGA